MSLSGKSYEFIPDNIKRELNIEGKIVGVNDKYIFNEIDIMFLFWEFMGWTTYM